MTRSISLHAPEDPARDRIMPINRKYNLKRLMAACRSYFEKTSRRISFEYTMIRGVSDTPEAADKLGALLAGFPCHVNLIPLNPVDGRDFRPSSRERVEAFQKRLEARGLTVTVRRSLGSDIDAACGQLKRSFAAAENARGDKL